ncbi:MAG: hypothetical protein M3032_01225 [Verrucomicrobiota bacterium]|nr:hypothetical protein [Verrucomicrobiota bacterium]
MKKLAGLLLLLSLVSFASAQDASDKNLISSRATTTTTEKTTLDIFDLDATYVWESDITNGRNYGKQDALEFGAGYSHRFLLRGNWYLRGGLEYHRFDFSSTFAPLPDHLQSVAAVVSLEYMVGNDVGAFLRFDPGFYFENDINRSSFDVPITLGRAFVLQPDKLFLFVGANVAFLRGQYPVLPLAGIVWRPNKQWTVDFVPPQPRVIYSPNDRWDFWVGGQLTGWSYRTDRDNTIVPARLNGAQVDYSEYRGAVGFTWHPTQQTSFDVGGGYVFQRRFNFERAGEEYKADPAPFVRAAFKAEF